MKQVRAFLILASAISLGASPAWAEDFNFTVPVSFNNLPPDVVSAMITCGTYQMISGFQVGGGNTRISITDGGFHGDVTIQFNATPGHDPASAHFYECRVAIFFGRSGTQYVVESTHEPVIPLQPGAPLFWDTGIQPLPL
jgi:hypothetical protein